MTKILFYSPNGTAPIYDSTLRALGAVHGWQGTDAWMLGVVIPFQDPQAVADYLDSLGVTVLPGVHDTAKIPAAVADACKDYGALPTHTTHEFATAMYAHHGFPPLRTSLW